MFQELFASKDGEKPNILNNMYVATAITAVGGFVLCLAGYAKIWPLFGACNQLVAVPAFLAIAVYLGRKGKNNKMLIPPMIFMLCATLSSLVLTFKSNMTAIMVAEGSIFTPVLQNVIIVPIVVLAVIMVIDGTKVLMSLKKAK